MYISEGSTTVPRVALLGTYVPRQCGIGTFTHDIALALASRAGSPLGAGDAVQVLAMNDSGQQYEYGPEVVFELRDQQVADYREAADYLNHAPIDLLCVQHEYGIFGGNDGNYLLKLLRHVTKPVVTTLHTVLREPTAGQRRTLQAICERSSRVVVMAERARDMLQEIYNVPAEKICFVPHGVPDVPFMDTGFYKDKLGVEGRRVLLTFGLLSPGKGIEVAIDAMAELVEEFPDLAYIVLGTTHPAIIRQSGEEYRRGLEQRVVELGLERNVIFHDRYASIDELCEYLMAADMYVTPYWDKEQIVSGTLSYALGCGKPIVSTPSWYAQELLADERGVLTPCGDSKTMAENIGMLLRDDVMRNQMRKRAYLYGRKMIWSEVASAYGDVFAESMRSYVSQQPVVSLRARTLNPKILPPVNLDHLHVLTDDTGIAQHAVFATPDRFHGYCIDDNARALIAVLQNWRLEQDSSILPLFHTYLSFMHHAFNADNGNFRNFMAYDRTWLEDKGSNDSQGRSIWALGTAVAFAPTSATLGLASTLFRQSQALIDQLTSPRAQAFALLGLDAYLRRFAGASQVRRLQERLAVRLHERFQHDATEAWPWFEPSVTYCNARIPQALILSGSRLGNDAMTERGLHALAWLFEQQTNPDTGYLSVVGNDGWMTSDGCARFDQQPVDAGALLEAAYDAYAITGDVIWQERMDQCLNWFLGANDMRMSLVDTETGGCRDGLHSTGVNANQGAESTLAWLMALQTMHIMQNEESILASPTAPLLVEKQLSQNSVTGD